MAYLLTYGTIMLDFLSSFQNPANATSDHHSDTILRRPPTSQDWARLNSTVGGRLHRGVPWTKVCFSVFNGESVASDAEECAFVQKNYFDHFARSSIFGAYSVENYESCLSTGDQCELDWSDPDNPSAFSPPRNCKQGSIPDYYIDVRGPEDVVAALEFVKEVDVPLVIKNTGHDFKGRSAAPGSLALWIHREPTFVPESCSIPAQQALTFGAGEQFQEMYEFANAHGLEIVGGADQTVGGAGGWVQGGGHSTLAPVYGMGVDRVLQYKAITPDGVFRVVNSCQNTDLFWALRGGGGGTFAIVLEATIMASPSQTYRVANINWPMDNEKMEEMLAMFLDNVTTLATQQWGGFFTPPLGNLILTNPKLSLQQAQEAVQPLIDLSTRLGGISNVTEYPNFLDWFNAYAVGLSGTQDPIGVPNALTTRLIPQKNHQTLESRAELKKALLNACDNAEFCQLHLTTPFGFQETDGKDTSINPIWRQALYQVILVNPWAYNATVEEKREAYAKGTKAVDFLREITPGFGAYLNEADIHEPNHEASFWGDNYERLLQIKNKYDSSRILDCWQCVGWKGPKSARFKCYI
ncbi:hypothetical protein CVT26_000468 [Gymnopilus dilepis]|uniref:FAD-binding PCMH-type domain-containing protein n=1 Tax=Gymnopilus dilepis TaxID=231916 RepID=A0A409Y2I0_9AGAR|nr:hypothetical protein CVT26_000468 [Gymnopilus dilepis]